MTNFDSTQLKRIADSLDAIDVSLRKLVERNKTQIDYPHIENAVNTEPTRSFYDILSEVVSKCKEDDNA